MTRRTNVNFAEDYEHIVRRDVGFGIYQIRNIFLLAIPCMASGFMASSYVFTAAKLTYRCAVPECDGNVTELAPLWVHHAIPETSPGQLHDCKRYDTANSTNISDSSDFCPATLFNTSKVVPCESFVYENTNTVVYDFGLECKEWLRALAGTLNSAGAIISLPVAGYLSDNFGRRTSVIVFAFNEALIGVVRAFSVNYAMFATLEFVQTAIAGGIYSAAYILAAEMVGAHHRVITSACMSSAFATGQAVVGLASYSLVEWRLISVCLFAPVLLLVSYRWMVPESHRWLHSKNRTNEAVQVLRNAAKANGKTLSEQSIQILHSFTPVVNDEDTDDTKELLLWRVLRSPVLLRRCCTTPVWWVGSTFIYYGLSINSVSLLGNIYFNYVAAALIEIPGYWTAVLVLDRIGRKTTIFTAYTICGVCCVIFAFLPSGYESVALAVYLVGKFSIATVFTSVYLYTSELYPTRHRHSFLGFSSMIGRVGSVVSPLTPPLMAYWRGTPSMMFGVMALVCAALVLTQPETLHNNLPNTLEDAENIGKSRTLKHKRRTEDSSF